MSRHDLTQALGWGVVFFAGVLDAVSIIGAVLIVAAGVSALRR
jgi:hypothetical protein